ncbi:MAG: hypothetical protein LBO63_00295 [Oscillospiraceae bacterium]|nr:hypothetical protein [Oscillospiraceae bacterium]
MKKTIIAALILALALSAGCSEGLKTKNAVDEFNENSTFAYKLTEVGGALAQDSDYEFQQGFGCEFYEGYGSSVTRSGYPDITDGFRITGIEIRTWECKIFDFGVGDQMEKADRQLKKYGYKTQSDYEGRYMTYTKGGVEITLTKSIPVDCETYNVVAEIVITVETTNKGDVLF